MIEEMCLKRAVLRGALIEAVEMETGVPVADLNEEYLVCGRALIVSVLIRTHQDLGLPGNADYRYYSDEPVSIGRLMEEFCYVD